MQPEDQNAEAGPSSQLWIDLPTPSSYLGRARSAYAGRPAVPPRPPPPPPGALPPIPPLPPALLPGSETPTSPTATHGDDIFFRTPLTHTKSLSKPTTGGPLKKSPPPIPNKSHLMRAGTSPPIPPKPNGLTSPPPNTTLPNIPKKPPSAPPDIDPTAIRLSVLDPAGMSRLSSFSEFTNSLFFESPTSPAFEKHSQPLLADPSPPPLKPSEPPAEPIPPSDAEPSGSDGQVIHPGEREEPEEPEEPEDPKDELALAMAISASKEATKAAGAPDDDLAMVLALSAKESRLQEELWRSQEEEELARALEESLKMENQVGNHPSAFLEWGESEAGSSTFPSSWKMPEPELEPAPVPAPVPAPLPAAELTPTISDVDSPVVPAQIQETPRQTPSKAEEAQALVLTFDAVPPSYTDAVASPRVEVAGLTSPIDSPLRPNPLNRNDSITSTHSAPPGPEAAQPSPDVLPLSLTSSVSLPVGDQAVEQVHQNPALYARPPPKHSIEPVMLRGVSVGFTPPTITTYLEPMPTEMPLEIRLPYGNKTPALHFQAPTWRHMLKLLARLSGSSFQASMEAIVANKDTVKLRTVIQFVRVHPTSADWRTILWLTVDYPVPQHAVSKYASGDVNTLPWSYMLDKLPRVLADGPDSPTSKYYVVPSTPSAPYATLPITFPDLAYYLQAKLDESRRTQSKLAKMVAACYPESIEEEEEEPFSSKRSGVTGLFKRVIGRKGKQSKPGGDLYDMVTPFVADGY